MILLSLLLIALQMHVSRSQSLAPPNFVSLLPPLDAEYFTGNTVQEIPEYAHQLQQCNTVNPAIDYNIAFPTLNELETAFQDVYPFVLNISAFKSDSAQIVEATFSNATLRSLLYAPITLALVIAIVLIFSVPMFITRCCCPTICCKPKFKIHRFPMKGSCGAASSLATSLTVGLVIFFTLVVVWSSFQSMFSHTQKLGCNIMESSINVRDWGFDILHKSGSDAQGQLQWASNELSSVNTSMLGLSAQVDGIFDMIQSETKTLQQNITEMEAKFPNITFGDLDQYLNISMGTFADDYAEAQSTVMYYLLDAENFVNNISSQINASSTILKNTGSHYLNMLTEPLFAFSLSIRNNNSGKTKSIFPEIPQIPMILPNGLTIGESLNFWTYLISLNSMTLGFLFLFPIFLPILCMLLGTCLLSCQYLVCCKREKDNISDSHQDDFETHNDEVKQSKRLGLRCCGCCLSRFGCGAVYFFLPIICILTMILIISNMAMHYGCGALTLSPKQLLDLADILDIHQHVGISKTDPQIASILELIESAIEENGSDSEKTIKIWKDIFMIISGTNITATISEALSEFDMSSFDTSVYMSAINASQNMLLEASGNFSNQFRSNNQDLAIRSIACNTCNASVWSMATDSYVKQGLGIPNNCTTSELICNSTGPHVVKRNTCQDLFCEAYAFTKDMDSLAIQFNSSISEVVLYVESIKNNLKIAETEFYMFSISLEERVNRLIDGIFAQIDLNVLLSAYSSITDQICYGVYNSYERISWGNFAICLLSPVLVLVQVFVHIRSGGIGHKQIQKIHKNTGGSGKVLSTSSAYRQPQPIDFDYDGQPVEDIYVNPIAIPNPPTPTREIEPMKTVSQIEIEMTTLGKEIDPSNSKDFSSEIDLDLVSSSPIV